MQRLVLLSIVFTIFFSFNTFATNNTTVDPVVKEYNFNDDAVFFDYENGVCFIDFEAININISEVLVKNEKGKVLFSAKVAGLPVNTIYEIDFKPFGKGDFSIVLQSLANTITNKISVR